MPLCNPVGTLTRGRSDRHQHEDAVVTANRRLCAIAGMTSKLHRIENWGARARDAEFSAHKLAKRCGVSLRSLERFFKETKAMTPQQWLHYQRLLQATSVLVESDSIKQAADLLGYKRASHFSREFKKHFGGSPSSFLNQIMAGADAAPRTQVSRLDTNRRI
ncbi:MAG: helix-turn-helix transcriptional regulator [Verrucomicrobia bacterium]|jgi:AraC-like DNA-binding protein|nr:helix-turn-helix transcriptional regulator [Verrucomicrobiota bacterium]